MSLRICLPERGQLIRLPRAPGLDRLFVQADRMPDRSPGRSAQLRPGFDWGAAPALPVAALELVRAGIPSQARVMRADPVLLQAGMRSVHLVDVPGAHVDPASVLRARAAIEPDLAEHGWRWLDRDELQLPYLISIDAAQMPSMQSARELLGEDLTVLMPEGVAGANWQRLLNDTQIALHALASDSAEALPFNAFWFWGEGRAPERVATSHTHLCSPDAALAGLAMLAGIAHAAQIDERALIDGGLIDLFDAGSAVFEHAEFWEQLHDHASRKRLIIELICADGAHWRWRRSNAWRFWRRSKGLDT